MEYKLTDLAADKSLMDSWNPKIKEVYEAITKNDHSMQILISEFKSLCHNLGVSEYDNYVSTAGESGLVVGFVYEISGENATSIRIGLFIAYTITHDSYHYTITHDSYQITYRVLERPSTSRYFQTAVKENSFDAFKKALIEWLEED